MLVESYALKLADLETQIRAIAPDLELPVRFRRPDPVFARTEPTRSRSGRSCGKLVELPPIAAAAAFGTEGERRGVA